MGGVDLVGPLLKQRCPLLISTRPILPWLRSWTTILPPASHHSTIRRSRRNKCPCRTTATCKSRSTNLNGRGRRRRTRYNSSRRTLKRRTRLKRGTRLKQWTRRWTWLRWRKRWQRELRVWVSLFFLFLLFIKSKFRRLLNPSISSAVNFCVRFPFYFYFSAHLHLQFWIQTPSDQNHINLQLRIFTK